MHLLFESSESQAISFMIVLSGRGGVTFFFNWNNCFPCFGLCHLVLLGPFPASVGHMESQMCGTSIILHCLVFLTVTVSASWSVQLFNVNRFWQVRSVWNLKGQALFWMLFGAFFLVWKWVNYSRAEAKHCLYNYCSLLEIMLPVPTCSLWYGLKN